MIKAFLSHSSADKDSYIKIVANHFDKENIVYDQFTFEEGEKAIDEIIKGLDQSELFVFFISTTALESTWVKNEVFRAKEKLLNEQLKKIYPIIIDRSINHKDERIPEWLRSEYNLKLIARPSVAARRIHQKLRAISWQQHPTLKKRQELFVGRNDKIEEFEERIDDFDLPKPKCIVASGVSSVGRRTFLRNAIIKTALAENTYFFPSIYLERNDSIEDFIVKVNDLGYIDCDSEVRNLLNTPLETKISLSVKLIKAAQDARETILVLDDGCLVNYKREISSWFGKLICDPQLDNRPVLGCASKYRVAFSKRRQQNCFFYLDIPELSFPERKRLFAKLIEIYDISLSKQEFSLFAEQFYGFPDQIIFGIDLISRYGINRAKKEIYQITEFNNDKASQLLKAYEGDDNSLGFIRLLAQFEIISNDFIFDVVDEPGYTPILEKLVSEHICEYIGGEGEFIRLNDTVRDYIKRNRIDIEDKYKSKITRHVKEFLQEDDKLLRDSSDYVFSIKEALAGNHKIEERDLIPSHFLRCMKDLYQKRGQLKRVVQLADKVLQKSIYLEPTLAADIRYYLCLALARRKDKRLLQEVQKIPGDEHQFILGYYYRLVGRHRDAIERLEKVIDAPYVAARARREYVQVLLQIEEYQRALEWAKRNYEENRGNQFHIQSYFNCLIYSDNHQSNKKTLKSLYGELEAVDSDQARQMGMIARALYEAKIHGDEAKSLNIIEDAVNAFPEVPYPLLNKFDIALIFFNIEVMAEAIEQIDVLSNTISISKKTLIKQKAYLEACKGNAHQAKKLINKELTEYPKRTREKVLSRIDALATKAQSF